MSAVRSASGAGLRAHYSVTLAELIKCWTTYSIHSMLTSSLVFFILLIRFCVCEAIFIFIPDAEPL